MADFSNFETDFTEDSFQFGESFDSEKVVEETEHKQIGIITGASSGLGVKYVKQLDRRTNLDEIWVIARRKSLLEELSKHTLTPIKVIGCDLTEKQSLHNIRNLLNEEEPHVRWLINCAGTGRIGSYQDITVEDAETMIDLNCRAAVVLTKLVLPHMPRHSHIMNICSIAAFYPLPYMNIYSASKAFLYRYSRALSRELRDQFVTVTAVCPYWIADTEFIQMAKKTGNSEYIKSFPLASQREYVAAKSFRDAVNQKQVSTPSLLSTMERIGSRLRPTCLNFKLWDLFRNL